MRPCCGPPASPSSTSAFSRRLRPSVPERKPYSVSFEGPRCSHGRQWGHPCDGQWQCGPGLHRSHDGTMGAVGSGGPISPASVPLWDLTLIMLVLEQFKNQDLFDSFCQACLAQMDIKPAYQNQRQKVDNFVVNTSG